MRQLRRLVWYIASRLLILCIVLGLCVVSFYYAMNLTNVQVILTDGLAARAETVMMEKDPGELSRYFFAGFLQNDPALQALQAGTSSYQNYRVTGVDHRVEMGFVWIWPWDETIRCEIIERVPHIDGRVKSNKADEVVAENGSGAVYPPPWQSAKYRVVLAKENGQWLIKSLSLLEEIKD